MWRRLALAIVRVEARDSFLSGPYFGQRLPPLHVYASSSRAAAQNNVLHGPDTCLLKDGGKRTIAPVTL